MVAWRVAFLCKSSELLQIACSEDDRLTAHRIEENVPIFRENIKIVPGMRSHAESSSVEAHHMTQKMAPKWGRQKAPKLGRMIQMLTRKEVLNGSRLKCEELVRLSIGWHTFQRAINVWIAELQYATRNA